MDLQLGGDLAVVIGAARGLGRAIAGAFAAEGSAVVLVDRDDAVIAAAGEIGGAMPVVADATDFDAMRRLTEQVAARSAPRVHLVYAAAVGSGRFGFPFWSLEPGDWERVLRVNLLGAVNAAHAFAPGMAASAAGTITLIGSVAGQIGSQTDPPYSASKAALLNFMQCAARDLAPHGVRVNAINPGMVQTALNRSVWESWSARQPESDRVSYDDWAADKLRRLVPLNRWQTPEDVAAMAVFLASPRAGEVTGQTINVDGGYVMKF